MNYSVQTVAECRQICDQVRAQGRTIHFIPTMGALHQGHCELIRQACTDNAWVCVSIFVNPLQFDDDADFTRYPRMIEEDIQIAHDAGADLIFTPSVLEIYPYGMRTMVIPGELGTRLEAVERPGHFAGMLTVVMKLLTIVCPDKAFFGEKDYQQLILITHMAQDFFLPTIIMGVPTVRESSGLALSSRNRFLTAEQLELAPHVYRALCKGVSAADPEVTVDTVLQHIEQYPEFTIDYCQLLDTDLSVWKPEHEGRLVIAARLGSVRLLDNIAVPAR